MTPRPSVGAVVLSMGDRTPELALALDTLLAQEGVDLDVVLVGNGWEPTGLPDGVRTVHLPRTSASRRVATWARGPRAVTSSSSTTTTPTSRATDVLAPSSPPSSTTRRSPWPSRAAPTRTASRRHGGGCRACAPRTAARRVRSSCSGRACA